MFILNILPPCYNWWFEAPEEGAPRTMQLSPHVAFSATLIKTIAGCIVHSCEAEIKLEGSRFPLAVVHFDGKGGVSIDGASRQWNTYGIHEFAEVFSKALQSAEQRDPEQEFLSFFLDRYYTKEEATLLSPRSFCGCPQLTVAEFAAIVNAFIASCEAVRDGQPMTQRFGTPAVLAACESLESGDF